MPLLLLAVSVGVNCAYCIENVIHPEAVNHNTFCAHYLAEGKLTEAEARCRLAIEFSPKYAEPFNNLGLIEYSRKNLDRAAAFFKEAISYKEDFAEAHNNLGVIFQDQGDQSYACDQFKQAIEIDPGYVNSRVNLGQCYLHDRDLESSRTQFLRCVELDPTACDCRLGLGILDLTAEDYGAALAHFTKLGEVCPTFAEGHYNKCYTEAKMGRCREAVQSCTDALAHKPGYIEAKNNLSVAYDCVAKQDGAVREVIEEIKRNPGDAEPHFALGALYEERNLFPEALNEYQNVIKLAPDHALAHFRAARVLDKMLRTQETVLMCKRFVDLLRDDRHTEERQWCVARVQELQFQ